MVGRGEIMDAKNVLLLQPIMLARWSRWTLCAWQRKDAGHDPAPLSGGLTQSVTSGWLVMSAPLSRRAGRPPCSIIRLALPQPGGEASLIQPALDQLEHALDDVGRLNRQPHAVHLQEEDTAAPSRALVGIVEGVIAGEAVGIRRREIKEVERAEPA
jgi:hypothetical protein